MQVELLDWHPEGGGVTRLATLSKHGNVVTDLSFHEQEVNLLATCSHDNYVYIWDVRTPRRPAFELRNMTGSIRVSSLPLGKLSS